MDLQEAHKLLTEHAKEENEKQLAQALHNFAVKQQWEEPNADEVAKKIRL